MMAYRNGFVVAILTRGQVLRESGGNVYLPYGSEYTIRLKNDNWRRAVAEVRIDGTDICPGGFIIPAHDSVDIERFVVDGNLASGRRFKFTSLDDPGVQDPTSHENGLVEVTFRLERERPPVVIKHEYVPYYPPFIGYVGSGSGYYDGGVTYGAPSRELTAGGGGTQCCSFNAAVDNGAGATVEGGWSNQSFGTGYLDPDDSTAVTITLRLRAPSAGHNPVFVTDTRYKYCSHCGKKHTYGAQYCTKCGKKF